MKTTSLSRGMVEIDVLEIVLARAAHHDQAAVVLGKRQIELRLLGFAGRGFSRCFHGLSQNILASPRGGKQGRPAREVARSLRFAENCDRPKIWISKRKAKCALPGAARPDGKVTPKTTRRRNASVTPPSLPPKAAPRSTSSSMSRCSRRSFSACFSAGCRRISRPRLGEGARRRFRQAHQDGDRADHFLTVTSGIAHISDARKVGRVAVKALVYFEIVSTFALAFGLIDRQSDPPRRRARRPRPMPPRSRLTSEAAREAPGRYLLNIIPDSVVGAFARGDILQVLLFFDPVRLRADGLRRARQNAARR